MFIGTAIVFLAAWGAYSLFMSSYRDTERRQAKGDLYEQRNERE
jgi:hypothetical protein